jgi:hypothetical protein
VEETLIEKIKCGEIFSLPKKSNVESQIGRERKKQEKYSPKKKRVEAARETRGSRDTHKPIIYRQSVQLTRDK